MTRYTADEMREAANAVDEVSINDNGEYFYEKHEKFNPFLVRDMLRQAADELEREEKREKDYEYAAIAKKHDGEVFLDTEHFDTLESAKKNAEEGFYDVIRYERREVGEWEEVVER